MRDIEIRLTADLDSATKEVAGFRKEYADLVKVVEKPLRQVNAFRELESNVEQTGKAMRDARERVRELANELARAESPSRKLQDSYRNAGNELRRLERLEVNQVAQLGQMSAGLRAAGVDTRNLAAEQTRLGNEYTKALAKGRADSSLGSAKGALGAGAVRDTQQALVKLREQYGLVKASGELSARDLGIAQANYRRSVSQTLAKLRELRAVNAAPQKTVRPAVVDSARESLGINKLKELRVQLATLTADYQRLMRSGVLSAQERAVAEAQYRRKVEESRRAVAGLTAEHVKSKSSAKKTSGGASDFAENATIAGAGVSAAALAAAYLKMTDTAKKMDAQLRLTTSSQAEFNEAQRATFEIAQRNQAPLTEVVSLYSRLQPAMAQMGRGQKDTLGVIDAVTQSLRISGATASETGSTITQFSQALGSGVLRGEEFNSIAENSPRLLRALGEALGVPTGALRRMAADGKLTAEVIVDALLGQLPKLTAEAAQLPETFGGAMERFKNQLTVSVKQLDDFLGVSGKAIELVSGLTGALSKLSSGEFGDFFRSAKQSVGGFNNEISVALARVRDLTAARARLKPGDTKGTVLFDWKLYNKAAFDTELADLDRFIAEMKSRRDKLAGDQAQGNTQEDKLAAERVKNSRAASTKLKTIQTDLEAATKKSLKELVKAERSATSELKKAKDAQLETQARYAKALLDLKSGPAQEPSYGAAQALKVGAQKALNAGDIDGAKQKANAALEMLQKMAEAGKNTYGFEGFIKSLQKIEESADKVARTKAEDKLQAIKDRAVDLKAELDKLKDIQITPVLSDEAVAKVTAQMEALKIKLGLAMVVPLQVKPTSEMQAMTGKLDAGPVVFPTADGQKAAPAPDAKPVAKKLKYEAGVTDYSQEQLTVPVQPVVSENAYDKMVREVAAKGEVPLPVSPKTAGDRAGAFDTSTKPAMRKLKYQPGVTDYSQEKLHVPVDPVVTEDAFDKMVREVAAKGKVEVAVDPKVPGDAFGNLDVPVKPELDQASVSATQSQVAAIADQLKQTLVIPVKIAAPASAGAQSSEPLALPNFARGDMVRGPGTGTSDSIVARLSNGEFVMRAAAVQHYGPDLLRQINERRLPKFAEGGAVSDRFMPSIPAPSQSLQDQINPPAPESFGSLSLTIGDKSYGVQAPQQELHRLVRDQRLKFGRTQS